MKTLFAGSDSIFALSLEFVRVNLVTAVGVFVLLPASALLNGRLSRVLFVLVVLFTAVAVFIVCRTQAVIAIVVAGALLHLRGQASRGEIVPFPGARAPSPPCSSRPRVLSGVSFLARPGTVTALVGATGAGKSTAMNLLQRLSGRGA